jgi:hypothetical protein
MKYQSAIFLSGLLSADVSAQMFKKVKLKDVDVLTLYQGKMTNGRRSSPIPQLQCRGGSAGCSAFIPDVVQCYNRGSDGLETQWECKTEMPMEYKFGKVQVSCEGYDYPDDPYILAGSCGLEYTIDRTGVNQDKSKSNKGSNSYSSNGWNNGKSYQDEDSSSFGLLVFICIVGFILFKALISPDRNNEQQEHQQQAYNPDFIPPAGSNAPPPPYSAGNNTQPPPYTSGRRNTSTNGNGAWANAASFGAGWAANSWWNRDSTRPRNRVYPDLHTHRDRRYGFSFGPRSWFRPLGWLTKSRRGSNGSSR